MAYNSSRKGYQQGSGRRSPGAEEVPVISKKYIDGIVEENKELEAKIEKAKQHPTLKRNVFQELKDAEAQVAELERKVEDAYYMEKNRETMNSQLKVTNKRLRELDGRLEQAKFKNRDLDSQVEQKKKLEKDFNNVIQKMAEVKNQMVVAKERSTTLEKEIRSARDKESEMITARAKIKKMEIELNGANRKLARLENSLRDSYKKWRNEPADFTRVVVNPGSSGSLTKAKTDRYGRPYKNGVNKMQISDRRSTNKHAREVDYRARAASEVGLRRTVLKLQKEKASKDLRRELLIDQNDKLAKQIRILKTGMEKMGVSLQGVRSEVAAR